MLFVFTIVTKVQTMRMDGEAMYQLHGQMRIVLTGDVENDPVTAGFHVDQDTWDGVSIGDVITFSPANHQNSNGQLVV